MEGVVDQKVDDESFVYKMEVPLDGVDEDEIFFPVFDFVKMSFEKIIFRFNELVQQLDSLDFDQKFKDLVKERESIIAWVERFKTIFYEGHLKVSKQEREMIEKEIKRDEIVLEEMIETLVG